MRIVRWVCAVVWVIAAGLATPALGQEEAEPAPPAAPVQDRAVTTADPDLSIETLRVMLRPLTASELEGEATAWMGLLREQAGEAADLQLHRRTNEQAGSADELVAMLRRQADLADRLGVVIAAWKAKGGATESYEKYIAALDGVGVDVTDVGEVTAAIRTWITSPDGGVRWLKAIGLSILTVFAFWILAKVVSKVTKAAIDRSTHLSELMRSFIERWIRRVVLILGFVVALGVLGVNVGPLVAAIGAAGLVIGLALQGTLSNFASGILILANRPFDVGDFINAGGATGTVESVSLFYTIVKSGDNQRIIIPNNSVWGGVITNITGNPTRRVDLIFGIAYSDDTAKAQRVLEQIVGEHELVLKDPAPVVRLHALADSSVNFICRPWTRTKDYWTVYWDVTREVKERFDAEGITIPFPQRDLHVYHKNAPATGG